MKTGKVASNRFIVPKISTNLKERAEKKMDPMYQSKKSLNSARDYEMGWTIVRKTVVDGIQTHLKAIDKACIDSID